MAAARVRRETTTNRIATGLLSGATTGIPVIGEILDARFFLPRGTWIPVVNPLTACVFQSAAFSRPMKLLGNAQLETWITPLREKAQLIAHLYEVDGFGWGRFITHGPVTLHNATPGKPTKISINMVTMAHQIEAMSSLALVLDTFDPQYAPPTAKRYTVGIEFARNYPATLRIPVLP